MSIVIATNVFAPDGLAARQQAGSWIYYAFDQQGNVSQRLNSAQSVLSSSVYDAYGVETNSGSPNDPFGYNAQSGYSFDRETGLYACIFRYYDPARGRWLNRDPISYAGGLNLYGYCGSGPVGNTDPDGKMYVPIPWMHVPAYGMDPAELARAAQAIVDSPDSYKRRNDKMEFDGQKWRNMNTDCGLFVSTVLVEQDPQFPLRGTGIQRDYLEGRGRDLWDEVPGRGYQAQPGDLYNRRRQRGGRFGHTELMGPNGRNVGASYGGHTPQDTGGRGPFPGSSIFRPRIGSGDLTKPNGQRLPSPTELVGGRP